MLFLLLSVLASAILVLLFKSFEKYNITIFQAIAANYITAGTLGFILTASHSPFSESVNSPWLPVALFLGFLFIGIFYLIGISTQRNGVAATSVANKMSLVIPVIFAVVLYHDSIKVWKIIGILLALVSVYLASSPEKSSSPAQGKKTLLLPLLIFFGSGTIDTMINYSQKKFGLDGNSELFVSSVFCTAACIGTIILLVQLGLKKTRLSVRSLLTGILLGTINYFSIYFLILTLKTNGLESSVVFPVNNMGVVAVSAFAAYLLFKEKLSVTNVIGILLSLVAIAMITWM